MLVVRQVDMHLLQPIMRLQQGETMGHFTTERHIIHSKVFFILSKIDNFLSSGITALKTLFTRHGIPEVLGRITVPNTVQKSLHSLQTLMVYAILPAVQDILRVMAKWREWSRQ